MAYRTLSSDSLQHEHVARDNVNGMLTKDELRQKQPADRPKQVISHEREDSQSASGSASSRSKNGPCASGTLALRQLAYLGQSCDLQLSITAPHCSGCSHHTT